MIKNICAQSRKKKNSVFPLGQSTITWWSFGYAQWLLIFMYYKLVDSNLVLDLQGTATVPSVHTPLCLQHNSLLLPLYQWKCPQIKAEANRYFSNLSKQSNNLPCRNEGESISNRSDIVQRQQNHQGNLQIAEQWESPCCYSKSSYNILFFSFFLHNCPWSIIHYLCFHRAQTYLHQFIICWLETVLKQ